jgi:hypothetical protein
MSKLTSLTATTLPNQRETPSTRTTGSGRVGAAGPGEAPGAAPLAELRVALMA